MSSTLYLLRPRIEQISPSLFQASEADIDIVFLEEVLSIKEVMVIPERMIVGGPHPTLNYDDLVHKIFSSDHIVVL
jgi:hypothetical protein